MPRPKNLARNPVRNFTESLTPLLEANGEAALLDQVNFSVQDHILRVNCHDLPTLERFQKYESFVTDQLLASLGLKQVVFRCNPSIALLLTLEEFEKNGREQFSLEELMSEIRKISSDCSVETIKGELRDLAIDLDAKSWHRDKLKLLPDWLRPLREKAPMIQKLTAHEFRLFRKPKMEEAKASTGKASKKSKKQN